MVPLIDVAARYCHLDQAKMEPFVRLDRRGLFPRGEPGLEPPQPQVREGRPLVVEVEDSRQGEVSLGGDLLSITDVLGVAVVQRCLLLCESLHYYHYNLKLKFL